MVPTERIPQPVGVYHQRWGLELGADSGGPLRDSPAPATGIRPQPAPYELIERKRPLQSQSDCPGKPATRLSYIHAASSGGLLVEFQHVEGFVFQVKRHMGGLSVLIDEHHINRQGKLLGGHM